MQIQLKANDGKVYIFSPAKLDCEKPSPLSFATIQLARVHLDKFSRIKPKLGADLFSVLGMIDFGAEVKARNIGGTSLSDVLESLAQAIFSKQLLVYELPEVLPVIVHQEKPAQPPQVSAPPPKPKIRREQAKQASINKVNSSPATASVDEMEYCGDPVSMSTGEEVLTLVDISLSGAFPLTWQRTYRSSLNQYNVGLGFGWRSNFHYELSELETEAETKIWRFTDDMGQTLDFEKVSLGAVSYHLSTGSSLSYERDSQISLTLSDGRHLRFAREDKQWLLCRLSINSFHGYDFRYSSKGHLGLITSSSGLEIKLLYDAAGLLTQVQIQGKRDELPTTLAHYHYDEQGNLCEASNRQQEVETYRYQDHLLIQRTRPSGFSHYFSWEGAGPSARCKEQWGDDGNYHYRFAYDPEQNLSVSTDSLGNQWQFVHNEYGRLIKKVSPLGHEWQIVYDTLQRKVAEITPTGAKTAYRYNQYGQLSEVIAPDKGSTFYSYNALGLVNRITDCAGRSTFYDFNSLGRLRAEHHPGGLSIQYQYDRNGRIVEVVTSQGTIIKNWWDQQGKLVAQQINNALTRYSYNLLGELNGVISQEGWVKEYEYSRAGVVTSVHQYHQAEPESVTTHQFDYDWAGRLQSTHDPLGRKTHFVYQGLSQPCEVIRPDGSGLKLTYDKERNLTAIERSDGAVYQFVYDSEERVIQTVGFDGRVQDYTYNGDGQLVAVAEQAERFVHLRRDNAGRVVEQRSACGKSTFSNYFTYDALGRLKHANNAHRKVSLEYHENDQVCAIWQDHWQITHTFDSTGRRVGTRLPDGHQIGYHYSDTGQLSTIMWQGETLLTRQFDVCDREVSRHYANGVDVHQAFDAQGKLVRHSTQRAEQAAETRHYAYNLGQQLVGIKDEALGDSHFEYDDLNQLISARTPTDNQSPCYDGFGNPTGDSVQVEGDRLLHTETHHYRYDTYGNQERVYSDAGYQQRQFNGLNQMVSVKTGGKYCQFQYDALGRRSAKVSEEGRTDFLWDGDQLIGEHCNGAFTWYLYEPETFNLIAMCRQGQVYFYHLDHLGTPLSLTDAQRQTVWQAEYQLNGDANVIIDDIPNPHRFQGQYHDQETGLHYNRFRYYDPNVGRFIHQDPIGLLGGINPYQYAPNPIQYVDPLGLSCKEGKGKTAAYKSPSVENEGLTNEQLSQIYAETASTIMSGADVALRNLIPDTVNDLASWLEQFLHQDAGSLGRMEQWAEVENEVVQMVANDLRNVGAVGTAMLPILRTGPRGQQVGAIGKVDDALSELDNVVGSGKDGIKRVLLNKVFSSLDEFNTLRGTGKSVGDLSRISGAKIQDIIANIPESASVRKLKPVEGKSQMGLEYKWVDENGITNRLRIHDPDPTHPGSNAANGWIARWQQKGGYYDPIKGGFAHKNAHNTASPHYDPAAANNTHIPIQTPETWLMDLMKNSPNGD
ncbi:polymorphic toxin type 30 domain-containing protein [Vibrio nereis]|uniref:polymorphic toxin type 30 domain-containing protein n=1 Tax=Vibrio nereis TaxID=693 RepID=UPI002493D3D1|nr:polymorphic toxin type 30 domain-containing protein [Vibrio nereis]